MARLRTTRSGEETRIAVAGRLTADDIGRLEHACAQALTQRLLRLRLDLSAVTHVDDSAQAFLSHLERRGALVVLAAGTQSGAAESE